MWRPPKSIKHPLPETIWPSADEAEQSLLFTPLKHGRLLLEQRTWVPAMVPWRASADGEVTPALIEWYSRFAQGQPGVLVVEATGIRDIPSGPLLRIGHDRYVEGLRKLTDAVHEASGGKTKIFIQLIDFLRVNRRPTAARYCARYLSFEDRHRKAMVKVFEEEHWLEETEANCRSYLSQAPKELLARILSPAEFKTLSFGYRESVNDTHLRHILELPARLPSLFSTAAERAVAAGFDGIELHYAHAYTMASFLSRTNVRQDGYGSSAEGRLRLPLEVFLACRDRIADDIPIGCRMLVDEIIEDGSRVEDSSQYAVRFARAGMDFISLSTGGKFDDARQPKVGAAVYPYTGQSGFECMPTAVADQKGPFMRNIPKMSRLRKQLRTHDLETPIVVAGGIQTFEHAESILREGHGDIIGSARQSLADPDWFTKMRSGEGHAIRRCTMTNYCEALDNQHKEVTCRLWDRIDIREPGLRLSSDNRRRLTPPKS